MPRKKNDGNKYQEILEDLRNRRQEILDKIDAIEAEEQPEAESVVYDTVDEANSQTNSSFSLRIEERELKLLRKIEQTIKSIEEGTYGKCNDCGKEISLDRLKARPVASLCIDCKTKQEKEEKRKRMFQ